MMTQAAQQFTGRHMAMIMVAFFTVVVGVNMYMVYLANSSWTGLVVKNSYVASQNFNELTARLEASKAYGIVAHASYGNGKVAITLKNAAGKAVSLTNPMLEMGDAKSDANAAMALVIQADGTLATEKILAVGQWSGLVSGMVPGKGEWAQAVSIQVAP
jgi:nitrogen fixation protein FixH